MIYNYKMEYATLTVIWNLFETINCFLLRRLHMTFREIDKILKSENWLLVRVSGSHHQYRKVGSSNAIVVPNHNDKDLTIGVIKDLEKKTGLSLRR